MDLLYLIQLCFSLFALKIDGYVLLAANLDDFRSIAKRFVPEKLAQQLADMASEARIGNEEQDKKNMRSGEAISANSEEKEVEENLELNEEYENNNKVTASYISKETTGINIDDIVKKVKEQLEEEYQLKSSHVDNTGNKKYASDEKTVYKKYDSDEQGGNKQYVNDEQSSNNKNAGDEKTNNKKHANGEKFNTNYEKDESRNRYDTDNDDRMPVKNIQSKQYFVTERHSRKPSYKNVDKIKRGSTPHDQQRNIQNDYDNDEKNVNPDDAVNKEPTEAKLFDEIDMLKSNDSYEDYVTPMKYQIYESKETTALPKRFNIKAKQDTIQRFAKVQHSLARDVKVKVSTDGDYDFTPGEPKARTEDMMFDDKVTVQTEDINNVAVKIEHNGVTKKSKAGTMMITREHFRMSSPNYYGKLPIVAEKYDFNEPIPEQDREPEDLRPIGNPPARVNHKVKLS